MISPLKSIFELGMGISLACLASSSALAESQPNSTTEAASKSAAVSAPALPPLPTTKSPVDLFRDLLKLNPVERRQYLTNRPPETQKLILAKLREYESLKPNQRELRLRATELRWYLLPLMSLPATNRAAQLTAIPPEDRQLVESRLQAWDKLSPEVQRELLDNEATIRYFTEINGITEQQKSNTLATISPERRRKLETGVLQWRSMPEEQRRKVEEHFKEFFELTPEERTKALSTLSEAERRQIEKTLRSFEKLPPAQRVACLRSFEKFANLSLEERQLFLKNAERWKLMSPDERNAWRELVNRLALQPPLPPGLGLPPLPPRARSLPSPVATTNYGN